jgi:glucose/arabinose dehydrogenase
MTAALALAFALAGVPNAHSTAAYSFRPFASGFDSPTYVAAAPNERNRLYVVEQPGRIVALQGDRRWTFLNIRNRVSDGGERGLLSVAFHPNYARNHRFYVDYTDTNGDTRVVEFRSNGRVARLRTARRLLYVKQPYANHNGGQLQFGPDGLLYVGMGDGGSGGDPGNRGQNLHTRLAKLLRATVTRRRVSWSITGYGLRNPWRFSFDRSTHDLWIADVGQGAWEEIDYRTRAQIAQRWNYGWSVYEGRAKYKDARLNTSAPLVSPMYVYSHDNGDCSITGGYVYRGAAVPAAQGRYFFGDYCSGRVWSGRISGSSLTDVRREGTVPNLTSFGESTSGELYAVSGNGRIFRLTP